MTCGVIREDEWSPSLFFCILLKNLTKNILWIGKIVVFLWCGKEDN